MNSYACYVLADDLWLAVGINPKGVFYATLATSSEQMLQQLALDQSEAPLDVQQLRTGAQNENFKALHAKWQRQDLTAQDFDWQGTDFQRQVWRELLAIPRGETISYQQLAIRIGRPKAYRAVANACGSNTIAVLTPCHRVLTASNKLSGYRWGVTQKAALLDYENSN